MTKEMTDDLELDIEMILPEAGEEPQPGPTSKERLEIDDEPEDRYSRLKLISWWDQSLLRKSRVMVVGAGAIGNELLKNLAMLGIGGVFVIDMDKIENSNLSRSVLFRTKDEGKYKAAVAASSMKDINPDIKVRPLIGNILHDVGLGVFRAMDVVLGGLDNREARLGINMACWKVTRPWIDGGIEVLHGIARVFVPPDGSCYECTMNETDYKMLAMRRSCALLQRADMLAGKVPTTPTTASIIAGVQVQEMLKLLHKNRDLPVMKSKGFFYNGLTHDSYIVNYPRKLECQSHETFDNIEETDLSAKTTTLRQALEFVRARLGPEAYLDLGRELIVSLTCVGCGTQDPCYRPLGSLTEKEATCPLCGSIRGLDLIHAIYGDENYLDLSLSEAGVPLFDIITGRAGMDEIHFELSGDRDEALGELA